MGEIEEFYFYQISCKDKEISEFYIGYTKNPFKRLEQHKREIKTSNNKLYKFLRQTGCWENWNFQIFDEQLVNKEEAYAYEQFLIYYLQPTLNKQGKKSLRKTMMTENYFLCSLIKSEIDPI